MNSKTLTNKIEEIQNNARRTKRFLALLVVLSSLSLGLMNKTELIALHASVSNIAIQKNHIIDILKGHEISIHQIQHGVQKICAINTVDENHANIVYT